MLYFVNKDTTALKSAGYTLLLRSTSTGEEPTGTFIEVTVPNAFPANADPAAVTLKFQNDFLPPDRYVGMLRLETKGSEAVSVPFTLEVRIGPALPLVLLSIGVLVGWVVRRSANPVAQMQEQLLQLFYQLQAQVSGFSNAEIRNLLTIKLNLALRDIQLAQSETAKDALNTELVTISNAIALYSELDSLQNEINSLPDATANKQQLLTQVQEARELVFSNAQGARDKINEIYSGISTDTAAKKRTQALDARLVPESAVAVPTPPLWSFRINDAVWRYKYLRGCMFGLLEIGIILVGFYTLYVKNGPIFGAAGLYDYLQLIFWGLGADVARMQLQNLTLPTLS
jgi:hypothetical protein